VSAGRGRTCGVTTDGAAYCWGSGVLGNGSDTSTTPVAVAGGLTFASVSTGDSYTCGVTTGGTAYCWGGGLLAGANHYSATPVAVASGLTFASVSAGWTHACGVTTGGVAYCWGTNAHGELGDGTTTDRPTPVRVLGQ
jgi:alpha-tubulin suppressor-like RCC1 family protein